MVVVVGWIFSFIIFNSCEQYIPRVKSVLSSRFICTAEKNHSQLRPKLITEPNKNNILKINVLQHTKD